MESNSPASAFFSNKGNPVRFGSFTISCVVIAGSVFVATGIPSDSPLMNSLAIFLLKSKSKKFCSDKSLMMSI